jgi:hypothetical protein
MANAKLTINKRCQTVNREKADLRFGTIIATSPLRIAQRRVCGPDEWREIYIILANAADIGGPNGVIFELGRG